MKCTDLQALFASLDWIIESMFLRAKLRNRLSLFLTQGFRSPPSFF